MAQRETPITAFVFWPAEREDPYLLPALTRGTCLYSTPTTIRVRLDHNLKDRPQITLKHTAGEQTQRKEGLYCMPNEETWEEFLNELATLQDALTALKDVVATLPVYSKRRDELERQKVMTNPVCRSGIQIWPIGKRVFSHWEPWAITSCRRGRVMGHSMHNIRIEGSGSMSNSIYDWHCCLTEADWQRTSAAHKVTKEAMGAVARRIQSLGKVNEAIKDLRYRDVQKPGMSAEVGMFEKKAPAKKRPRAAKQKTPTKQAVA